MLELICILVENGATTGNTLYKNYWKQRLEPEERTVFHYLAFPPAYRKTYPSGYVEEFDPFQLPHEGPLLERTRQTLLDFGADPYALDNQGMHSGIHENSGNVSTYQTFHGREITMLTF
jgi:hypothetical protein